MSAIIFQQEQRVLQAEPGHQPWVEVVQELPQFMASGMSSYFANGVPNGVVNVSIGRGGRAYLDRLYCSYPLKLVPQQAQKASELIQMYAIGHGGGLVSGDYIHLDVTLNQQSMLLLKTQGSTKVYKSIQLQGMECPARSLISGDLRDQSLLLSLPDPITCFTDSSLLQAQTYRLTDKSSCCLVEWFTCGRESSGEIWRASRIRSNVKVFVQDRLVLLENLDLQSSCLGSFSDKIGGCVCFGSVILVGPRTLELRERLQVLKQRQSFTNHKSAIERGSNVDPLLSLAEVPGGAILRFSAVSVEDSYCLLALIFSTLGRELKLSPSPYLERIDHSSLAKRMQVQGSIFNVLSNAFNIAL
jgi:urease accessory protein